MSRFIYMTAICIITILIAALLLHSGYTVRTGL